MRRSPLTSLPGLVVRRLSDSLCRGRQGPFGRYLFSLRAGVGVYSRSVGRSETSRRFFLVLFSPSLSPYPFRHCLLSSTVDRVPTYLSGVLYILIGPTCVTLSVPSVPVCWCLNATPCLPLFTVYLFRSVILS